MIAGSHSRSRLIRPATVAGHLAPAMGYVGSRPDFVEEREGDALKSRIKYGYDERYRLASVEQTVAVPDREEPVTETVSYAYDDAGRVTGVTTGQGRTTGYSYYDDGSVHEITSDGALTARYSYNGRRLREKLEYFNGAGAVVSYTDYDYDNMDRLTSIHHKKAGGSTISRYQYTYDEGEKNQGLRTSQTRTLDDGTVTTLHYDYDDLYQLTAAGTWDGDTMEYGYDANGNMTEARRVKDGAVKEIQTYTLYSGTSPHAGMNRLQRIGFDMNGDGDVLDNGDYAMSMDYDANGNMISRDFDYVDPSTPDVEWDYGYDAQDRMVSVSHGTTLVAEYGYDALGRRVLKRKAGESATAFFYDREDVVEEYDAGGSAVARSFVHGPGIDDYVSMTEAGGESAGAYFYHADGLGSVTDLTSRSDSSLQTRYQYAAFGKAAVLSGAALAALNPHQYTGRDLDPESGLMYYRSRYYDPGQRRFGQEDAWGGFVSSPLSFVNKYQYVENSPVLYSDPRGYGIFSGLGRNLSFSFVTPKLLGPVLFTGEFGLQIIHNQESNTLDLYGYMGDGGALGTPGWAVNSGYFLTGNIPCPSAYEGGFINTNMTAVVPVWETPIGPVGVGGYLEGAFAYPTDGNLFGNPYSVGIGGTLGFPGASISVSPQAYKLITSVDLPDNALGRLLVDSFIWTVLGI